MVDEKLGVPAPMVLALIICDGIHQDPATKKCTLLGTFSTISVRNFPATHRQLAVHAVMTNGHGNTKIRLTLVAEDEESTSVFSQEGQIDFRDPRMVAELNFGISNIKFEKPGPYRLQIYGNDMLLMERRLNVFHIAPRPPAQNA